MWKLAVLCTPPPPKSVHRSYFIPVAIQLNGLKCWCVIVFDMCSFALFLFLFLFCSSSYCVDHHGDNTLTLVETVHLTAAWYCHSALLQERSNTRSSTFHKSPPSAVLDSPNSKLPFSFMQAVHTTVHKMHHFYLKLTHFTGWCHLQFKGGGSLSFKGLNSWTVL